MDQARVRPLFEHMTYNLVPLAAIEGTGPGRVWVDDPAHPTVALLWDLAHELFIVAEQPHEELGRALSGLLAEVVFPEAAARGCYGFVVHFWPDAWGGALAGLVLKDRSPVEARRWLYMYEQAEMEPPRKPPAGLRLQPVDAPFLARPDQANRASLEEWLRECWRSPDAFLQKGLAYCLLEGGEVISWCGVEYPSGPRCGLGVETEERHRSKGYAALVASACVRDCLARGLAPHWDCWASNPASARVAEKLGFRRLAEYRVYWCRTR
jgi:RimJ/RimL family protein N-acetyltransferase